MKKSFALILLPSAAMAHPGDHGHSTVMANLIHLLTQPDHLMMMGAAAVIVAALLYRKKAVQKAGKK